LHNFRNGVSQFYKPDANEHVKNLFKYKFPEEKISKKGFPLESLKQKIAA